MSYRETDQPDLLATPAAAPPAPRGARLPIYTVTLSRTGSQVAEAGTGSICTTPATAAAIFAEFIGPSDKEHFVMAALDARNRIIGLSLISMGTLTSSLVHPREVFKAAILLNAAGILVGHSHPSGDPTPSPEDRDATRRLQRAGEIIGIPIVDHIVIGEAGSYKSFREGGLL